MLTRFAPAKINLALDILYKRPDGYHEIDSVMQTIALADKLTFEPQPLLELACDDGRLPTDQRNLVWQAAELLKQTSGVTNGVKIQIYKNIPLAAGLAGGSTDAAETLLALNDLWKVGLSKDELIALGVKLGADVPFCIQRGTARAGGIGEKLSGIESKLNCSLLLVTQNIEISTAKAYSRYVTVKDLKHPQVSRVETALEKGDFQMLIESWGNVFEELGDSNELSTIRQVKDLFYQYGLNANLMSGSGPSVFALDPPSEIVEPFLAAVPPEWSCCLTQFLV
jgi:4-diphosphocytidyl-2-C-methyl-D-erythritol kinase